MTEERKRGPPPHILFYIILYSVPVLIRNEEAKPKAGSTAPHQAPHRKPGLGLPDLSLIVKIQTVT